MFRMDREALTISGVIFGGFTTAVLVAMALRLVADKIYPESPFWFRLLIVAPVVLVLGYLLFPKRGKGRSAQN
jgi:hypothetical protein